MARPRGYNTALTKKEQIIYNFICNDGIFTPKKIAKQMNLSSNTIKTHLNHIYEKLFVHSIAELIWAHFKGGMENEQI